MTYHVLLTDDAAQDLDDLCSYISHSDSTKAAEKLLDTLEKRLASLAANPERGVYPRELLELGIKEFREIHFKPYRMIYRVIDDQVYNMLITDGRRDMQSLLERRLLG